MPHDIKCPACYADAVYRYGRLPGGKQRYMCQVCNRQFSESTAAGKSDARLHCPACGAVMHVYRHDGEFVRYRCSRYPNCKTFHKEARRK